MVAATSAFLEHILKDVIKYMKAPQTAKVKAWFASRCPGSEKRIPWHKFDGSVEESETVTRPTAEIRLEMDIWLATTFENAYRDSHIEYLDQDLAKLLLYQRFSKTMEWLSKKAPFLLEDRSMGEAVSEMNAKLGRSVTVIDGAEKEGWFQRFLNASKGFRLPVLVKNAAGNGFEPEVLTQLVSVHERKKATSLYSIPYGGRYSNQKPVMMSMTEYLAKISKPASTQKEDLGSPVYYFQALQFEPGLRVIKKFLALIPQVVSQFAPPQLSIGGRQTGAPVHFHQPAFNLCITGSKKWFLFPPDRAVWSDRPIKEFLNEELPILRHPKGTHLEVEQTAGDILFVPFYWGHGVLNTADGVTIGVAQEVDYLGLVEDSDNVRVLHSWTSPVFHNTGDT